MRLATKKIQTFIGRCGIEYEIGQYTTGFCADLFYVVNIKNGYGKTDVSLESILEYCNETGCGF